MPQLLPPVVAKLAQADSSPLIVNLLLVIAQLVHINTTQLVDCLAAQPAPGGSPMAPAKRVCHCDLRLTGAQSGDMHSHLIHKNRNSTGRLGTPAMTPVVDPLLQVIDAV